MATPDVLKLRVILDEVNAEKLNLHSRPDTAQDLKTSRGLHEEMKKAASSNVKQVIDWVLEKTSKN